MPNDYKPSNRPVAMYTDHAMPLLRPLRMLILTAGLVLYAQDASMVLRTSVTYRTQRNTLTLSDEQRQQADQFSREAEQANRDGKFAEAIRSYYHGMAVMRGISWTPAFEFASSLQGRLDHAIAAPGATITVTVSPGAASAWSRRPCSEEANSNAGVHEIPRITAIPW